MCSRFIEDFTNKVVEKSCCKVCKEKRRKCHISLNEDNDFHYLNKEVCQLVDADIYLPHTDLSTCLDVLLSCLHNRQYAKFLKFFKLFKNENDLLEIREKIKKHMICFDDTEPVVKFLSIDPKDLSEVRMEYEDGYYVP